MRILDGKVKLRFDHVSSWERESVIAQRRLGSDGRHTVVFVAWYWQGCSAGRTWKTLVEQVC